MALLAEHSPDSQLRDLYGKRASEARHFGLYWTLASRWPREVIGEKLACLAEAKRVPWI